MLTMMRELAAIGHEAHFCHIEAEPGDNAGMRQLLGGCFHPFSYTLPTLKRPLCNEILPVRIYNRAATVLHRPRLDFHFRRLGRRIDDWYDDTLTDFLRELQNRYAFDAVIVAYAFQSKAFKAFPSSVLRILDTVEKFCDRWRDGEYYAVRKEEQRGLLRADRVLAIQQREAEHFRSLVSPEKIFVVGHIVEPRACRSVPDHCTNLLFLGSANDANREAIRFFVHEIWPHVRNDMPSARLQVAGEVSEHVPAAPGVEKLGVVKETAAILDAAAVVLCPLRFGTGLKIKVVEALACGKAVVATSIGAEGLEQGSGRAIVIADDALAFASSVTSLLRYPAQRRLLERSALGFMAELNKANRRELVAAITR